MKAFHEYKSGVDFCYEVVRFGEMMENCLSAAKCAKELNLSTESEDYLCRGLKTAHSIKNRSMIIGFEAEMKPTSIFLLRHGESEKNLTKTINCYGSLTETGKNMTKQRAKQILEYLKYSSN